MFIVLSAVYSLCLMGSLGAAVPASEMASQPAPSMNVSIDKDGTKHLELSSGSSFSAKPSDMDLWEVSGTTPAGSLSGALKVESSVRAVFSGTVFLADGQHLTTQIISILTGESMKAVDMISEEIYTFTKQEVLQGPSSSMQKGRILALCSALAALCAIQASPS